MVEIARYIGYSSSSYMIGIHISLKAELMISENTRNPDLIIKSDAAIERAIGVVAPIKVYMTSYSPYWVLTIHIQLHGKRSTTALIPVRFGPCVKSM